jgi:hypothetical protein
MSKYKYICISTSLDVTFEGRLKGRNTKSEDHKHRPKKASLNKRTGNLIAHIKEQVDKILLIRVASTCLRLPRNRTRGTQACPRRARKINLSAI